METKERFGKHILAAFIIALGVYLGVYAVDNHLRHRKGPWQVEFTTESNSVPVLVVNQPALGIAGVRLVADGDSTTNAPGKVAFDFPKKPIPFASTKFEDLTYLPGSVVFDFFGHEVELLPRTLIINKREHAWKSGEVIHLPPDGKLRPEQWFDPRVKKRRPFGGG